MIFTQMLPRKVFLVFATILAASALPIMALSKKQSIPNSSLLDKRSFIRGGSLIIASQAADSTIPELRPPKSMYSNAADIGSMKASLPALKILLLGILSGAHIAFGKKKGREGGDSHLCKIENNRLIKTKSF